MTIDAAIEELQAKILAVSPSAVIRVMRVSAEEARIRVYAPANDEAPIKDAVLERTISLLSNESLDVHVLVYDIATSLPPPESE